ncbi:hypothetical protein KST80_07085 [Fusobacterium polymorphum]|uniref:hypothetical protein n=1 Tax=Fusobacterium TaxID=848 RepID=UPI0011C4A43B|nr:MULTISPECIES: hypothetical protein [Fusobacterium]
MYIILIFPKYVSLNNFNASRLSPSIYKFSVVSKFTLSSLIGLKVLFIGEFASIIAFFFSGHVNSYLSSFPSTTLPLISCLRTSISIVLET